LLTEDVCWAYPWWGEEEVVTAGSYSSRDRWR